MADYTIQKIIHTATGLVVNRHGSASRTPAKGDAATLYTDTGSKDQRFLMVYNEDGQVYFQLESNPELVLNVHSITGALMFWPLASSTKVDILFDTRTTEDGRRIIMPAHGKYITAPDMRVGGNLVMEVNPEKNGSQYFELKEVGSGSGNANSGASTNPTGKKLAVPCTLQKPYGDSYCYACCVLDISTFLHPAQGITMETLIGKGCVRRSDGYVNWTTPYYSSTQTCIGAAESVYCAAITEQVNLGLPVTVKISVKVNGKDNDHFVTAIAGGATADEVLVNDPMLGCVTLRQSFNRKGQKFQHIRTIKKLM